MAGNEVDLHLPSASKKILTEIMDYAENHNKTSFCASSSNAGTSFIFDNSLSNKNYSSISLIGEFEEFGLIKNTSGDMYVFTPLAYRWWSYEKKGSTRKFFDRLWLAVKKFFSTVRGIVVGIVFILGAILTILQILRLLGLL